VFAYEIRCLGVLRVVGGEVLLGASGSSSSSLLLSSLQLSATKVYEP